MNKVFRAEANKWDRKILRTLEFINSILAEEIERENNPLKRLGTIKLIEKNQSLYERILKKVQKL